MKRNSITVGILSFVLTGVGVAQGTASPEQNGQHYTQAQLKARVREARAPEQYNALASYYGDRQRNYSKQAAEEKLEWERRSQNVMSVLAKYPRPVDSARYLYEFYTLKAAEAGELAAKYRSQGAPNNLAKAQ